MKQQQTPTSMNAPLTHGTNLHIRYIYREHALTRHSTDSLPDPKPPTSITHARFSCNVDLGFAVRARSSGDPRLKSSVKEQNLSATSIYPSSCVTRARSPQLEAKIYFQSALIPQSGLI